MTTTGVHKIRPAGRHVLTIGRDLIQSSHAAVLELVKNAYDADSPDVDIEFRGVHRGEGYSIILTDHGHGMTRNDVINKWLVPSTSDKLRRRSSPNGRLMQGRKGVGRYAASILGKDLLLETVTSKGEKTEVYIEWEEFERATYLDDVEILVETSETDKPSGTRLTITGDAEQLTSWDDNRIRNLRFELSKLKSPIGVALQNDEFTIRVSAQDLPNIEDQSETIEPFPIFNLFDYRISGTVNEEGKGILQYSMQKVRNAQDETITFEYGKPTNCGELTLDIRVYDRDSDSISALVGRGLKDDFGNYIGNLEARRLLTSYNGIGVYRNGFRIRPMGDPDFDWLKLNEQRVQAPSQRIGSNQVIGFVLIKSEEQSGLIEKSARDGLKDNEAFENLKGITTQIIRQLERRRFTYRRRAGLSRPSITIDREIDRLFASDDLKREVQQSLFSAGISGKVTADVLDIISSDERERNKVADSIRQAVAIYQGQATLGKIVNVILHEGRRPLHYFRDALLNLRYSCRLFIETRDPERVSKIVSIAEGMGNNAEAFVTLFSRLDPLAAKKRSRRGLVNLKEVISEAIAIFSTEIKSSDVLVEIRCPEEVSFLGWSQDFYAIFTNLIDNSIYWMTEKSTSEPKITITIEAENANLLHIDFRDTGPGIEPELIESEVIFEPQFSTKPYGTGLGLAIAGEAAARNGLRLEAFEWESGAWFRLEPVMEEQ